MSPLFSTLSLVFFLLADTNALKLLRGPMQLKVPMHLRPVHSQIENLLSEQSLLSQTLLGPAPITQHNWGNNFRFSTINIQYPTSVEEVQQIVKNAKKLRVLGTRHSFSKIADCHDTMLSTLALKNIIGFDASVPSITVQAGITYTDLNPYLQYIGFALPNLASLAEISVAGAAQTGAHGSGASHGCLATQIRSLQIVLANGTVANYGPNDPELKAIAVGLGAFGVITQVELQVEPTFNLTNYVFVNMPEDDIYDHFDEIENLGYSVQLFTDFSTPGVYDQVWVWVRSDANSNVGNLQTLYGSTRSYEQVSPIDALPPTYIMDQGKEQPWYYGLVDYHDGLSGFDGAEIQSEYFLPYENAVPALQAVSNFSALIAPRVFTMLIRTIKGDDLWMSESFNRTTVSIHFTWKPNMTAVMEVLPQIEQALLPYDPRVHWGKVFNQGPDTYLPSYAKLSEWKQLAETLDPTHKFRNQFLEDTVFSGSSSGGGLGGIIDGIGNVVGGIIGK
ncbi:FAD binding domain-containing protein [Ditylenchus destructor]|uniref:FAD binding domain-containing protein n=1 Tax=Ditylenchus destructor TaxID=166010 RepID=A0AAD4QWH8_9BILA|nr:FAD binding domain-containing protein [Ditylenchus destructor]